MAYKLQRTDSSSGAVLYISAGIKIDAPAAHVFDILISVDSWSDWNSFCPSVSIIGDDSTDPAVQVLKRNSKLAVQVRMTPTSSLRTQNMAVTELEMPSNTDASYKVCWKAEGFPRFVLRTLRTNEIRSIGGNEGDPSCEYRTFEIMAGPAAYTVKAMYESDLHDRFADMAQDLKAYAEKTWRTKRHGVTP